MENSIKKCKLSFKLILLVKTGTETNARSRIGTMTYQKCLLGTILFFDNL